MDWKIFVSTFGGLMARLVPEAYVRFAAGGLFILFGIYMLLAKGS